MVAPVSAPLLKVLLPSSGKDCQFETTKSIIACVRRREHLTTLVTIYHAIGPRGCCCQSGFVETVGYRLEKAHRSPLPGRRPSSPHLPRVHSAHRAVVRGHAVATRAQSLSGALLPHPRHDPPCSRRCDRRPSLSEGHVAPFAPIQRTPYPTYPLDS